MNLVDKIIKKMVGLLHLNISNTKVDSFIQFVKFGIVGASNTIISYVIIISTLYLLKRFTIRWDYVVSNFLAFVVSVLWSFYWNNKYVFAVKDGEKRDFKRALLKAYASYAFSGIVVTNILSWIWIDILGISKLIAPLINLIVSVPLNFIINKLWTFRNEG